MIFSFLCCTAKTPSHHSYVYAIYEDLVLRLTVDIKNICNKTETNPEFLSTAVVNADTATCLYTAWWSLIKSRNVYMKLGFVSLKHELCWTDITVGFCFSDYNTRVWIIFRLRSNTAIKCKALISRSCLNLVRQTATTVKSPPPNQTKGQTGY